MSAPVPAGADNWWRRPLRAVHTVLREPDAAGFDLPGLLAWLRDWRANVYAVNGGGLCAFYQTEVPLHRKNRFLDGRDLFKEIVDACHDTGIKVVARMDFRGLHREAFETHPDWAAHDVEGRPRTREVLYAACPNSPYRNEGYAIPLIDEVLGRCGADGIWENATAFGGRCYCPHCRRKFREDAGADLPRAEDWDDPVWCRYVLWRYACVREHTTRLRDVVKRHGADRSYCGEFFAFLEGNARENAEDVDHIRDLWDYQMGTIFALTRGSHGSPLLPVPVWRAEEDMKYLRATGGGTAATAAVTSALGGERRATPQTPVMLYGHFDNQSRYTTPNPHEAALWLAGMAAQGGSPWNCSFVGVPPSRWWDQRHQDLHRDFYHFMADHEADFAALESVADVALVHSQRTQDRFAAADPARDGYITHVRGWELALFAAHHQWDVLPPSALTVESLARYRAVVLPNVACLSDEDAAALRRYVERGGAVVATFETGCYTAGGAPRDSGALDDVFGIGGLGVLARGPLPHSYLRLQRQNGAAALLAGFEDTTVLTSEGHVRAVTALPGARVCATLIPEIFPQPPDLSYPVLHDVPAPFLVTHHVGAGRAVYFAGQTDRLNLTSGHPDHGRLLANALGWALDGEAALETDAPPHVHITLLRQPATGRLYVHLVNYTGARGRPVVAPFPLGPIRLSLDARHAPALGGTAALLVSGSSAPARRASAGRVEVVVPRLDLHEVVRLG
ncbi:MAG TPA: alpha-amylase family protein [Chloroflexota bacterium]|nr:alpha-amylase family protein [Chloroflexota bacterium]